MSNAEAVSEDVELLLALPDDIDAYGTFYRRYVRRVTGFAAKRCSSADDVADAVAYTFVRLLTAARRYSPERGDPAAFLFGIAANVIREQQRAGRRHVALVSKLAGRELLDADDVERIDAAIDASRRQPELDAALADVPPGERQVIELVAEGHTPSQAGDVLGISHGAARVRLSRARSRLRPTIAGAPAEEE
jgi:RNA polymerase sigma-70 factor, ECF subfamily